MPAWLRNPAVHRTAAYYLLLLCLGLSTAVIGPTLPALGAQTGTRLGEMGALFLAGALGFTLGTAAGGRVFDRVRGHPVLGVAQMAAAAMLACVPFVPWFWLLLLVLAAKGFAEGLINTGANTLLVWTHGSKVGPYMNGLHFCFGLGAFLAPFLIAQVIGVAGGYRWAYVALAAFAALVGLRVATLGGSPQPAQHQDEALRAGAGGGIDYPLVIAAALFLFFYVGAEVAFGGWVYTYAVTLNLASAVNAAYLTSAFWFAFTVGRLLSIPLATRFTPRQVVPAALCACLALLALLIAAPGPGTVWGVALGLGFCMAPVWPMGFTLAGQSLKLTARASGLILLGDSFGGMILPWLVGKIIDVSGPQAMVVLVLASVGLNLLAFVGMVRLRPAANRTV